MNGLVVAPAFNSPPPTSHPHDATGAFQPRAKQFAKLHDFPAPSLIDNTATQAARALALTRLITHTAGPLQSVGFFCHGTRDWLQLGPTSATVGDLARTLATVADPARFVVELYACLTGEDLAERGKRPPVHFPGAGDGSFADLLRDHLLACGVKNVRVFAHTTAGDAWDNHNVRIFDGSTTKGGEWLVEPGSADWPEWNHRMHHSDLWARAPFMTRDEVLAEVRGGFRDMPTR